VKWTLQAALTGFLLMLLSVSPTYAESGTSGWVWWHFLVFVTLVIALVGISVRFWVRMRHATDLVNEQERLELALQGGNLGLWDWNMLTGEVIINDRWAQMLEYLKSELNPTIQMWQDLMHPDDRAGAMRTIRGNIEGRESVSVMEVTNPHFQGRVPLFEVEYRAQTKSGEWKWVVARGKVFEWSDDGVPLRAVGTHLDVTASKRAAEELDRRAGYEGAATYCARALADVVDVDGVLPGVLDRLRVASDASRAYIFQNHEDPQLGTCMNQTHESCAEGAIPQIDNPQLQNLPYADQYDDVLVRLKAGEPYGGAVRELAEESRNILEIQGVKTVVLLPIFAHRHFWGFIGFDDCVTEHAWKQVDVEALAVAASLIGGAIERRHAEQISALLGELSTNLSVVSDLHGALGLCVRAAFDGTDADCTAIYVADEDGGMSLAAREGLTSSDSVEMRQLDPHLVASIDPEYPLFATPSPEFPGLEAIAESEGLRSIGVIPVLHEGAKIAMLVAGVRSFDEIDEPSRQTLETMGAQIGGAIVRLQARDALRQSEEKYRLLIESINDVIFTLDREGIITYVSPAVERFSSFRVSEITGMSMDRFVHPDDVAVFTEVMGQALEGSSFSLEYRVLTGDNDEHHVRTTIQPLVENGQITGVTGAMTDLSERIMAENERNQLQEHLRQNQKVESLGKLAGGIAHHFNNLLQGIVGSADLAADFVDAESPVAEYLANIHRASERAANLAGQMLAYSGRGRVVAQSIEVNDLLHDMDSLVLLTVGGGIDLRYNLGADIPEILGSSPQIRQAIMALVTNAAEAIGQRDGIVGITTNMRQCTREWLDETYLGKNLQEGRYLEIEVQDTGIGMGEDVLSQIFDPFFTTKEAGRGLGLSAVLGILRGHKGLIRARSVAGFGATFTMLFPAYESEGDEALAESVAPTWSGTGTVLLIDDEEIVASVVGAMLRTMGFTVVTASDGPRGLELFKEHADEIVLVLLDLVLPGMGGVDILREIRLIDPAMRVLISSGYDADEVTSFIGDQRPSGYIQKPYHTEELREHVSDVLGGETD
jgi:PAS domain S-box-containing protein